MPGPSFPHGDPPDPTPGKARVDVWLWSVRLFKTRSQASAACQAGHVLVRSERAKPSTPVKVGDEVRVKGAGRERIAIVRLLLVKRVGAPRAAEAFEDLSPPPQAKDGVGIGFGQVGGFGVGIRERGSGRPTKADRRKIDQLRGRERKR